MNNREINEKIDELREVLNTLMSGDYRQNYENILELSVKLDNLIAECYKMKDN
ncbi:Spo0E family sporulation regulatory protein-aspartic acid phosphatase [Clostridium chromiireducens]|uniref:Spo0E family sporulation regulatory protein-aspartic acid phosphatase n=1 Tax=Clostridium chromiireducens TaxID=225345 RepID=A0A964RNY9_9CLOT|nr:Spo0E family sporulation regulatory protein-aspartic acid phosphatase [Clostridium chromiireducens]